MTYKAIKGGDKLEARLRELAANLGKSANLTVGWQDGTTYPNSGMSVATVAAIQEFGAPSAGIPPRPFVRRTIAENSDAWGDEVGAALKQTGYDATRAMELVGMVIEGELAESIFEVTDPPLSPVTLMLREMRVGRVNDPVTFGMLKEARARVAAGETAEGVSTKPLVDSGLLSNSITSVVK